MPSVIGIDLGGTKIAATRYTQDSWEIENTLRIQTHANKGFEHVMGDLEKVIHDMLTKETIAIGIGVPGLIHHPEGMILKMPNIPGGEGIELGKLLTERMCIPVIVDNDANCFTLSEAILGAGRGQHVVVGITMGTGVGGGIVIKDEIFHGSSGFAGEFGHMLMRPGKPPYTTDDLRGDVEQFLSGSAMGKRCEAAENPEEYLEGEVCEFMRPEIFTEVAWLCTNLIHVLDPSVIVFGGSAGHALKPYLPEIEKEIQKWTLPKTPIPALEIYKLTDSATRGAALLALQKI